MYECSDDGALAIISNVCLSTSANPTAKSVIPSDLTADAEAIAAASPPSMSDCLPSDRISINFNASARLVVELSSVFIPNSRPADILVPPPIFAR